LPDWYVSISIALDAEEEEWHNRQFLSYLAAGGDPKKFPKKKEPYTMPAKKEESTHDVVMGALGMLGGAISGRKGSVEEYASSKGLKKVYEMPDGTFVDEAGDKVEPQAGSVFVKSKRGQ